MLKGKNILLGITGSIAAYKAAMLCRLLRTNGAQVKVIMTPTAKAFITPLTMATLSKNPIAVDFYNPENGDWHSHISMGEWADCFIIAPATANTIAKMATGIADNLLLTTYLSARCKTIVAPAMDCDMFSHVATQHNIETLRQRGVIITESPEGELASGLTGKGRMAEPEQLLKVVCDTVCEKKKRTLEGKTFLVTAGATQEAIDPVRYITNHSTGKMGYAIAGQLAEHGANVILISGHTTLSHPAGTDCHTVTSAEEMYRKTMEYFPTCDGAVLCAAVADYTPLETADHKIKKGDDELFIRLKRTRDIALELGKNKNGKILVGFAMETDHCLENAKSKLTRKNLDLIVLNSILDKGAGFGTDTNKVTLISQNDMQELPLMSKKDVADHIVERIAELSTSN